MFLLYCGARLSDCDLLLRAVALHQQLLDRKPYLVTADVAFFSKRNENAARAPGVKRVAIPNRSTKSSRRKELEKERWFRNVPRWRTGCEGRISLLKRHRDAEISRRMITSEKRLRGKLCEALRLWIRRERIIHVHDLTRTTPGCPDRARNQVCPGVDVLLRITHHGGASGRTARSVNPHDTLPG